MQPCRRGGSSHGDTRPSGKTDPATRRRALLSASILRRLWLLITLVLNEKYTGSVWIFYSNRALRIFPIYWTVLILYVGMNILAMTRGLPVPPSSLAGYQLPTTVSWIEQHGHDLSVGRIA